MMHELRLFLVAVQFLTRLPVPRMERFDPDWLSQSSRYFPAVGTLVGALAAVVFAAATAAVGPGPAAWITLAATVLLTGAFHEDGFADTCDGLGGAVSKQRALEIMKDSRIGAYGAVGVVLLLGIKATTLSELPLWRGVFGLIAGHTLSRAGAISLTWFLPYAGDPDQAKAKPLARLGLRSFLFASMWSAAVCVAITLHNKSFLMVVATSAVGTVLVCSLCATWLRRRLGGFTGDTLGATQQVSETVILLLWLAVP